MPEGAIFGSMTDHKSDHENLVRLLAERSARRGTFTLSSGATSELYIDARTTTMSPEGLQIIGPYALKKIRDSWNSTSPDSVGGLTLGADPISYAVSYASILAGETVPMRCFTVRKEAKAHGTAKRIEGSFKPNDKVVIIEDVITTGGSAIKAIEAVKETGATIIGVLALVDREEGGREAIEKTGVPVQTLVTATEILKHI